MSYTKEDILRIVEEEEIEFIRMQFVDIFGQLKNVAITASQTGKALNNQIMFDGSSIEGEQLCYFPLAARPGAGGPAHLRRVRHRRHPLRRRPQRGAPPGGPKGPRHGL